MKRLIGVAVCLLGMGVSVGASLSDGLVAYYPFQGNANDVSGNNNHAVVYGSPSFHDNYLKLFDNTENYLSLPHSLIDGRTIFSISAYVKLDVVDGANALLTGAKASDYNSFGLLYDTLWDLDWYQHANSGNYKLSEKTNVEDHIWIHIVYIFNGGDISFFLNGELQNTKSVIETSYTVDDGGLIVGQEQDSVGGSFQVSQNWEGEIDELRFYNRALSQAEVTELYEQGVPSLNQGLIAYYPLDGDAKDYSGNGHDGTVVNVSSTTDRFNDSERSLLFDSSWNRVELNNQHIIPLSRSTFSAWIYPLTTSYSWYASVYVEQNSQEASKYNISIHNGALHLLYRTSASGSFLTLPIGDLTPNEWYHVVVVKDGIHISRYLMNDRTSWTPRSATTSKTMSA